MIRCLSPEVILPLRKFYAVVSIPWRCSCDWARFCGIPLRDKSRCFFVVAQSLAPPMWWMATCGSRMLPERGKVSKESQLTYANMSVTSHYMFVRIYVKTLGVPGTAIWAKGKMGGGTVGCEEDHLRLAKLISTTWDPQNTDPGHFSLGRDPSVHDILILLIFCRVIHLGTRTHEQLKSSH